MAVKGDTHVEERRGAWLERLRSVENDLSDVDGSVCWRASFCSNGQLVRLKADMMQRGDGGGKLDSAMG